MNIVTKNSFEDLVYWKLGSNRIGKPEMYVLSFLIDGLLVDTGQPLVENEFMSALKGHDIDQIVVTHHHEDHSGNVNALKNLTGLPVYASPKCCEIMRKPPRVTPAQYMTWGQNKSAILEPIDLNKKLETRNLSFDIIETPGHAVDQISLYEKNRGWLFSGDIYLNDHIKIFMNNEKIDVQIQSLEKLLRLDFDVLICCHNPHWSDGKKRLKAKLDFLQNFYGEVQHHHGKGMSTKEIMSAMGIEDQWRYKLLTLGRLSKQNMVQSAIDAIQS